MPNNQNDLGNLIRRAIKANPAMSNYQIAQQVGCGETSVRKYRKFFELPKEPTESIEVSPSISFQEEGNKALGEFWSRTPMSLDEALFKFKVDTDTWIVERYVCNQWEQGSKLGSGDAARIQVTPLFQIKMWLIRKEPIAVSLPEFKTIAVTNSIYKAPAKKSNKEIQVALIVPDIQVGFRRNVMTNELDPFHDRKALDLMLQLANHIQPDRVVFLGDNLDLPEWSDKFVRTPDFNMTTQHSAVELAWWLGQVRQLLPSSEMDYLSGNHEHRLEKAICNYVTSAYDLRPADQIAGPSLLSVERLLGLEKLNIKYHGPYPSGRVWLNENLSLVHGTTASAGSGVTTKNLVNELRASEGMGHIHKVESVSKTLWGIQGPKVYTAFSPGTLARIDPGVVPSGKPRNNWQQGLGVVQYEPGNGYAHIQLVIIYNGAAIFDGHRWEARSLDKIVGDLNRDTGFKF